MFCPSSACPSPLSLTMRATLASLAFSTCMVNAQTAPQYQVALLAGNPAGQAFNTAADGLGTAARFTLPFGVALTRTGDLYLSDSYNRRVCRMNSAGLVTTVAIGLNNPEGLAVDDATGDVYIVDAFANAIYKMTPARVVTALAGQAGTVGSRDGVGTEARFNYPREVALDGAYLYVTDSGNHTIRRIDKATGAVTTLAGVAGQPGAVEGIGSGARFSQPWGIAVDRSSATTTLVVADYGNHMVRRITLGGAVAPIAGAAGISGSADGLGTAARFFQPGGVTVDAAGNLFISDTYNHTIRKITAAGLVSTIAGAAGQRGLVDGLGSSARFSAPQGIAVDGTGRIFVADTNNGAFRMLYVSAPPVITGTLANVAAERAAAVAIAAPTFTSPVYPAFQWFKDGQSIPGATNATLALSSVQALDAGAYFVRLSNPAGAATSNTFTLTVKAPPVLTSIPEPVTLAGDGNAVLRVTATGAGPIAYQWSRAGVALAGQTSSTLATDIPGAYAVAITNPFGTTVSTAIQVRPAKRLLNLSTLGSVRGSTETLIAGFAVSADDGSSKQFLIRGVGPGLAQFGLDGTVPLPALTLYRGTVPVGANTGWSSAPGSAQLAATASAVGAFALAARSADSAMLVTLPPGNYTAELAGLNGATGLALVEIYEVAAELNRLVNLSTRGTVTETSGITAGLVIGGSKAMKVLVRAIGPSLASFGVADPVARPQLKVLRRGELVASNSGWGASPAPEEIVAAAAATGAFSLPSGSADAALVLTLPPGDYTAQATALTESGTALVEIYEVR